MKRKLLLATSLLAVWVSVAFGDSPFLKGTYAFTGNDTCLVSLGGFDSLFQPTIGSIVFSNSLVAKGTINFDGNGHGTVQGTTMVILAPPLPVFITPSASTDSFQYQITYTVDDDNGVTDSMVPGSYSGSNSKWQSCGCDIRCGSSIVRWADLGRRRDHRLSKPHPDRGDLQNLK